MASQTTKNNQPHDGFKKWTFLNNHTHVLLCLAKEPEIVLRKVAQQVGITERATQKIVKDLVDCQVLTRQRKGRCNSYQVDLDHRLHHPLENQFTVGELLSKLLGNR